MRRWVKYVWGHADSGAERAEEVELVQIGVGGEIGEER
jgi:hypothetical protein